MAVDPWNITDYNRNETQLQEFLIFCVFVAGKTAKTVTGIVDNFLWHSEETQATPFETVQKMMQDGTLRYNLERVGAGQYTKLTNALYDIVHADFDLGNVTPEELETVRGIGPKTSRFFVLHSRAETRYAVIDVHIARWLDEQGHRAPQGISSTEKYSWLEARFLEEADKRNQRAADLDLAIWRSRAKQ